MINTVILIFLQCLSLFFTGIGASFSQAAAILHICFIRRAAMADRDHTQKDEVQQLVDKLQPRVLPAVPNKALN